MDVLTTPPGVPGAAQERRATGNLVLVGVAAFASFFAAWLVFSVQPMATRMVLPRLGGSAAVWNTSLVFFQLGLLAGYALTHLTTTKLGPRAQVGIHLGLVALAALTLPIDIGDRWAPPASTSPSLWLIGVFAVTVGVPYLALSAISPLVQRWFSLSDHPRAADPYFLYAASNAGSLLGLLTYPLVVEPLWSLDEQARAWALGYGLFAFAMFTLVVIVRPDRRTAPLPAPQEAVEESPRDRVWRERLTWIGWAFIPSSLMVGVTTHITTDVASIPLFWVIPLAIYLVTYIVAFGTRHLNVAAVDIAFLAIAATAAVSFVIDPAIRAALLLHLALLASAALAFHGRLAAHRPTTSRLTEFFLCTSLGGVLGGAFNALVAPVLFPVVVEYALVLGVAAVLVAKSVPAGRRIRIGEAFVVATIVALAFTSGDESFRALSVLLALAVMFGFRPKPIIGGVLIAAIAVAGPTSDMLASRYTDRTFYGPFAVDDLDHGGFRALRHGTTLHGGQWLDPRRAREPVTYYTRTGPVGRFFTAYDEDARLEHVGVIGLGAGGLAAYSTPDRSFTFFEIDPAIADLALDENQFTYLSGAPGPIDVELGDGRLSLERQRDEFGTIVVDAFTSDAIPVHLLTREAFTTYFDHLDDGGFLVIHFSNKYLDLEPVIGAIADELDLATAAMYDSASADEQARDHKEASKWVVVTKDAASLAPLLDTPEWDIAGRRDGVEAWTDGYSNLISVLTL